MPTSVVGELHNLFTDRRAYQTQRTKKSTEERTITPLPNNHLPRLHNALRLLKPGLATRPHPLHGPNTIRRLPSSDTALPPLEPCVLAPGVVADPCRGAPPRPLPAASLAFAAEMLDAGRRAVSLDFAGRVRDASVRLRRRR
jgi:hypothetical protein